MSRYLLTPEAKEDLNEIRRYLSADADLDMARFVLIPDVLRLGVREFPYSGL